MNALKSLAEAQVGQRLSFVYYGGETPGTARQVDVEEVRDDRIVGTDVVKQETRQYLFEKAAIIVVVTPIAQVDALVADLDIHQPAEAACDVEPEAEAMPTTRVRRMPMSFPAARDRLHQQIEALNGEDLAEVLGEIEGEDRSRFDAESGQVILERDVLIPHCEVNDGNDKGASIDWVNEDGVRLTTTFFHNGDRVLLQEGDNYVTAEDLITKIAQHLGLTIS